MISVITERIWTKQNDELTPRDGELILDSFEGFHREADTHGPLYVAKGLSVGDVAVFLAFWTDGSAGSELPTQTVGYLVGQVDTADGSGIIISGHHFDDRPSDWVNDRIINTWQPLMANDYSPDEFGLYKLTQYLDTLAAGNQTAV